MNRLIALLTSLATLTFVGSLAQAAGISGSKHDFSSSAWNSGGQICRPCHTPHNGMASVTSAPLWNHAQTTTTFTVYSNTVSPTFQGALGGAPDITGVSKLCLSCHDGTVALDNFGTTPTTTTMLSGSTKVGNDLSNDHPVGFVYNTALATADGGLKDPSATPAVSKLLFGGRVECSSCHDVHNGAGMDKLLAVNNTGSALCLTCHVK
jgi:predicted CXXCH cytochrome family protein